jgi:hypothetical protein
MPCSVWPQWRKCTSMPLPQVWTYCRSLGYMGTLTQGFHHLSSSYDAPERFYSRTRRVSATLRCDNRDHFCYLTRLMPYQGSVLPFYINGDFAPLRKRSEAHSRYQLLELVPSTLSTNPPPRCRKLELELASGGGRLVSAAREPCC